MLESLEQAIIVIKGKKIEFQNQNLTSMLGRVQEAPLGKTLTSEETLKLKFMQVYHKNVDDSDKQSSFGSEKLSINDIAALDPN